MKHTNTLCVYCGSGPGRNPAYAEAARTLGRTMTESGVGLVYGGGSLGLMGEVAQTVLSSGGRVIGVIPQFLVRRERMLTEAHELIVTNDMHERKMTMFEHADGFVALPGGIGTLEELVEVATWAQLGQHSKPIIIANIEGYWTPLLSLLGHMRQEEFLRPGLDIRFHVVEKAEDIVPRFLQLVRARPPGQSPAMRSRV